MIAPVTRAFAFGALVCLASWIGLAFGAGNVGLQQSLSLDAVEFATRYPAAVVLSLAAAFSVAFVVARALRTARGFALLGALAVLVGDIAASFVAAPVLVGELEPQHGVTVLLAVSLYGSQILAAWLGAALGAVAHVRPESDRPLAGFTP